MRSRRAGLPVLVAILLPLAVQADNEDLRRLAEQRQARCEAISPDAYWTGLIFNPKDLETGFERSKCFQALAEELRDPGFCRLARERTSLFFDGSGVSPVACKAIVARRIQRDIVEAGRIQAVPTLLRLTLNRDGNGSDIDVHVRVSDGAPMGYWLTLSLVDAAGVERPVHQEWQSLRSTASELTILIRSHRLPPGTDPDRELTLLTTLERRPRNLDEQAIYAHLPAGRQISRLQQAFRLSALQRAPLTRP